MDFQGETLCLLEHSSFLDKTFIKRDVLCDFDVINILDELFGLGFHLVKSV